MNENLPAPETTPNVGTDGVEEAPVQVLSAASVVDGDSPLSPAPAGEKASEKIGTFHAFRYSNYRLLWIGDLFTAAAQWIQQTTMSWVVYDLTGSGSILGAVNAARLIPTLICSPIAGTATDRMSRNRIIAASQFGMFLVTFILAIDLASGQAQVWHLFLFTILVGIGQTFNMPARQTFVFELVPRSVIPNAVALSWLAFSLARLIGPAVGGLLISLMGPANNFFLQAFAYLSVMVSVMMIEAPPREPVLNRPSFFQSMRAGYSFALGNPLARVMVLMSIISPLFIIPLHAALLPIFAKQVFHSGAAGFGLLVGSIGFGGLFGGLLTASLNRVERRGLMQLFALSVFSLSEVVFSLVAYFTGNLWLSLPFLVIAGAAESLYTTTNTSVLQLLAPEHLRGSMAGVLQISILMMPIGSLVAGTLADVFGAPAVGATITFIAFSIGLSILIFSPRMRSLQLSDLVTAQEVH